MENRSSITVATDLNLSLPLYRATAEVARRQGVPIGTFCRNVCVAAFYRFDEQNPVENVGPGTVFSIAFFDIGDDIQAALLLSPELVVKLDLQAGTHHASLEFICQRVCISALEAATGETNARVAHGSGASRNDLEL